jgi:hypothetical protein
LSRYAAVAVGIFGVLIFAFAIAAFLNTCRITWHIATVRTIRSIQDIFCPAITIGYYVVEVKSLTGCPNNSASLIARYIPTVLTIFVEFNWSLTAVTIGKECPLVKSLTVSFHLSTSDFAWFITTFFRIGFN